MEIADVVAAATIEVEWGNDIRDRTIQRYDDIATRTSENSSPTAGDLAYMQDTGDVDVYHSGAWRHVGSPVGTVEMLAGGSVPTGWLLCNGQAVSRTTYAGLFAQISTTWGVGDGSTTFNVPDMRGRVPRGVAASGTGNAIGDTFGADTHTHTGPSHTHGISGTTSSNGTHFHGMQFNTQGAEHTASGGDGFETGFTEHVHEVAGDTHNSGAHTHTFSDTSSAGGTGATGSSSTIQAGAALNFIIKT